MQTTSTQAYYIGLLAAHGARRESAGTLFRNRARVLRESMARARTLGASCADIARVVGFSHPTVSAWVARVEPLANDARARSAALDAAGADYARWDDARRALRAVDDELREIARRARFHNVPALRIAREAGVTRYLVIEWTRDVKPEPKNLGNVQIRA
jgi:hypothetical protein